MFHSIPDAVRTRMAELEAIDSRDREDGTERMERLRQIPPVTGKFIALQAAVAPPGDIVEIGTSAGYSTLWLALAARETGRHVTTFETLPEKATLARETFRVTYTESIVTLVEGDARDHLADYSDIGCCFLDAKKEVYLDCYELVVPRLVSGGILLADNATNHAATLQPMLDRALTDPRVDALIVPVGKGVLLCRKV